MNSNLLVGVGEDSALSQGYMKAVAYFTIVSKYANIYGLEPSDSPIEAAKTLATKEIYKIANDLFGDVWDKIQSTTRPMLNKCHQPVYKLVTNFLTQHRDELKDYIPRTTIHYKASVMNNVGMCLEGLHKVFNEMLIVIYSGDE